MYKYNENLLSNSQELRKNMTPEENHLWYDFLKLLPFAAKRQKIIEGFIVDFYIPKAKIVIELDGRQHLMREHHEKDSERDKILSELGIEVLRFSNEDINKRFNTVCNLILDKLGIKASEMKG